MTSWLYNIWWNNWKYDYSLLCSPDIFALMIFRYLCFKWLKELSSLCFKKKHQISQSVLKCKHNHSAEPILWLQFLATSAHLIHIELSAPFWLRTLICTKPIHPTRFTNAQFKAEFIKPHLWMHLFMHTVVVTYEKELLCIKYVNRYLNNPETECHLQSSSKAG